MRNYDNTTKDRIIENKNYKANIKFLDVSIVIKHKNDKMSLLKQTVIKYTYSD